MRKGKQMIMEDVRFMLLDRHENPGLMPPPRGISVPISAHNMGLKPDQSTAHFRRQSPEHDEPQDVGSWHGAQRQSSPRPSTIDHRRISNVAVFFVAEGKRVIKLLGARSSQTGCLGKPLRLKCSFGPSLPLSTSSTVDWGS
jgi:hypothetical protein